MIRRTVYRTPTRAWLGAVVSLPLVALGADLVVFSRLFPNYQRRFDLLVSRLGHKVDRPFQALDAWGVIFVLAGGLLAAWAIRELLFPRPVLGLRPEGLALDLPLGPGSGSLVVPWTEVREAAPAAIMEEGELAAGLAMRVNNPERLPRSVWGGRWVEDLLVLRADDWEQTPAEVAKAINQAAGVDTATAYVVDENGGVRQVESDLLPVTHGRLLEVGPLMVGLAVMLAFGIRVRRWDQAWWMAVVVLGLAGLGTFRRR